MAKKKGNIWRMITFAAVVTWVGLSLPLSSYAAEMEGENVSEEDASRMETEERALAETMHENAAESEQIEPSQEELSQEELSPEEREEQQEHLEEAADDVYIDAASTARDERNTCQINMTAILPDKLRLDLFADVRNLTTHTVYRLPLYYENGYTQRCYVESGEYVVTNIGVYGDTTGKYGDFLFPEDFSLSDSETVDLFTMLADEEPVQRELDERMGNPVSDSRKEEDLWGESAGKEEQAVLSDYKVEHTGSGGGIVGITGDPACEHELVIRIVKGGIPGIMSVKYSLDGEQGPWSEETAVPLAGNIRLYNNAEGGLKDSGLMAYFSADPRDPESLFEESDAYSAYIPDPATEVSIRHKGDGAATLEVCELVRGTHAFHLLYEGGYAIRAEILRGGSYGDAVLRVSTDGGKNFSEQMLLPEDGEIPLPEVGVKLVFSGSDNASMLIAGDTYSVDAIKQDYRPLIVGVSVVLLIAVGILYGMFRRYMLRKLPGISDYLIEPYIPYAEREKQRI